MKFKDELKTFLYGTFPLAKKKKIGLDDPLLSSGIIDSLGVLEIVNYIIEEKGIILDEEDLVPEHFETIRSISSLIESKLMAA